ncbi:hypothetical protein K9K83_03665 [Candidatus Woesearchaeota archaeon]|nr:hypothetical protein [Candidatus Woesearchaeota archaeon]
MNKKQEQKANETTKSKFKSIREIVLNNENIDKTKLKINIRKAIEEFYSGQENFTNISITDFIFITMTNLMINEEYISNKSINYISDILGDHTKKFLTEAQTKNAYLLIINPDEASLAVQNRIDIYEFKANKYLFNTGILYKYHQKKGEGHIKTIKNAAIQAYRKAADITTSNKMQIFTEIADTYEYLNETINKLSDEFILGGKNEYTMKIFKQSLGNNPLRIPTIEQQQTMMRMWNIIN